ncbi:MAG: germination protein YpeB [Clostridia bacterium]|nr:germination protein YpeB [Clostridia bacterium]
MEENKINGFNEENDADAISENATEKNNENLSAREEVLIAVHKNAESRRAEKERLKAERFKEKTAAQRERNRVKTEKRERIRNERREKARIKRENSSGKNGGMLAAVISLSLVALILASALTYTVITPSESDNLLETSYRRSFYDAVEQVDNMDVNLSKALATKDGGATQLYLTDLAVNSELAESGLQQLPLADENKFYTTKIVNQVGDYAKYLNKKIVAGEKLTDVDYENLRNLRKANSALKNALQNAMKNMDADYSFRDMRKRSDDNVLLKNFDDLQELSVEYPELIYDGPFSDGRDEQAFKGLSGNPVTEREAEDIFRQAFGEYGLKNVKSVGVGGVIKAFNVQAEINGEIAYAQISEKGGKILTYSYAGSCNGINYDGDYATEKAAEFLANIGFTDLKPVWINQNNNLYTINFATEKNGVIYYSELVKARVCAETGMIIGIEATGYYSNRKDRAAETPALTKAQAVKSVYEGVAVETARLVKIPVGKTTERLCYEFSGEFQEEIYYIYIDAENGRQLEMFKVINSEEGSLLI